MKMVNVGLLGLGRHGRRYADHLSRGDIPEARLAGFWRRDAAAAAKDAEALGIPALPTPEALIAAVDVVVVVVPAQLHAELTLAAVAAGRPVLLEKPMAPTAAAAQEIVRSGGWVMLSQTLRFDPLTIALEQAFARERLGRLVGFQLEQRLEPRGLAWEDDPEVAGGGVLIQTGIHGIDALRFISQGRRLSVRSAALTSVRGQRTEDHALLTLEQGGVLGQLSTSKIGGSRHHRYALYFEHGGLEADYITRTLTEVKGRTRQVEHVPEVPTVVRSLSAFLEWVSGKRTSCPVTPADAAESLAVVFEAYRIGRSST